MASSRPHRAALRLRLPGRIPASPSELPARRRTATRCGRWRARSAGVRRAAVAGCERQWHPHGPAFQRPAPDGADLAGRRKRAHLLCARRHPDRRDRCAGPRWRGRRRRRAPHRPHAGEGRVLRGQGRRHGEEGPGPGRDGSHEDGAHHCRAG
ncbi:MAG: hypothetical protein Q7T95_10450 [Hydrogenophaga sp.]|nr:hypothetical protein [Hydrogenophaga sp.]MDO9435847.1 hypothetical protein [Hydrogenophaga sp.]